MMWSPFQYLMSLLLWLLLLPGFEERERQGKRKGKKEGEFFLRPLLTAAKKGPPPPKKKKKKSKTKTHPRLSSVLITSSLLTAVRSEMSLIDRLPL